MTDDTLIEAMARALYDILEGPVANQDFARQQRQWDLALTLADAALAAARPVIRNEALEQAARVADENAHAECDMAEQIAAHIRALKEKA